MLSNLRTSNPSLLARRRRRLTSMAEESTTGFVIPCPCKNRCSQKPSRPASSQRTTGAVSGRLKRRLAWAISSSTRSCCRAVTVRSRGFCPWPVVKPSFQVFSLRSKATNSVAAVVLPGSLWGAAGVIGFLLHGDRSRVMEKKLTNSGPLRESVDKHSIYDGRNLHFGIREHAMGAAMNGMALIGLRSYGSGFLIFSDYSRPTLRLASLMELPVVYIFTHDSIGVGEDGPTHQPIEHLASLRAIPHLTVLRPADSNEVAEAWKVAMEIHKYTRGERGPVALILSRQALPTVDRIKYGPAADVKQGAYVLADTMGTPDVILMATGSEVQWCMAAYEQLQATGIKTRVVSMPSWEIFEHQPKAYRDTVLPPACRARIAVEMASTFGWYRYVGLDGGIMARGDFGASAPLKDLLKYFGFTVEHIVAEAKALVGRN